MKEIVWSDAARALFALSGPTAVSAGAGSGKTTCLVELCVRLLSGEATGVPCEPRSLVAITFTEKAAAELDERLRQAVAERAAAAPPESDEARAWLARAHALDGMAIGTIHGFARRILRDHALAAGLDPELEILDEEQAGAWRREAALAAVLSALDAGDEGVQRLVGAHGGAGASRGLAGIVCDLVRERATLGADGPLRPGPDPEPEAHAARASLLRAVDDLLAEASGVTTTSGRNAIEALRAAAADLNPCDRTGPLRLEALPAFEALAIALRGWRVGKKDSARALALKEEIARRCEELAALVAGVLAMPQAAALCAVVTDAEQRFRDRKREAAAADFDDLLVATRDLLRRPEGPRDELRRSIRALLVDEYQDVNRVQQEIFELLADPDDPSGPVLVGVGDVKQSIYRFRGADVSVFRGLLDRLARGRGRVLHLTQNHRSTAAVLSLVNEVSARSMQPRGGEPRAYELAFRPEDRLLAARTDGVSPACEILEDGEPGPAAARRRREAETIAARIGALVSGAAGVEILPRGAQGADARPPRPGDVALLFRRLTQVSEYEQALRDAGIPCRVARGGGFYQAPEVRDLGELAATLSDPEDQLAWAAVLRSPLCAVGDGALLTLGRAGFATLVRRPPREIASEIVARDPEATEEAERLERFLEVWAELWARRGRVAAATLLTWAVDRLDVEAVYALAGLDGERRGANLRKALAVAERLDRGGARLADVARHLRRLAGLPPREPEAELDDADAVTLLSIHQAKGLEWPIVFVPDLGAQPPRDTRRALLQEGRLAVSFYDAHTGEHRPTRDLLRARAESARAAAAESRRLLYVALTRARDRLVLSGEAGRASDTWRELVEGALAERPALALRIPAEAAGTGDAAASPPFASSLAAQPTSSPFASSPSTPALRAYAQDRLRGAAALSPHPEPTALRLATPLPRSVRIAVTRLAEHARCPRRSLLRDLGLVERTGNGGPSQDDPDRATARGTLAHALIAEIDLGAPPLERRAQLAAVVTRRGYDPSAVGVRRILADVTRFLDAPPGRALADAARAGRLRREVPFLLRVAEDDPPACYLDGAIDAMIEGDRDVTVVDFKYALPRADAADRYRLQLVAYAAAAGRASGRPVRAQLQFLRGDLRAMDLTPDPRALHAFLHEAGRLARAAAVGEGRSATPEQLGRTAERCRAERCGFVDRCYR